MQGAGGRKAHEVLLKRGVRQRRAATQGVRFGTRAAQPVDIR